ncbi:hypothetical protein I6G97_14675 [Edwardsiella hoshinae]|uniref:MotA/TolQ/ExbB proton channel domain-containing protein n=1 Tax=Edwardsiella hoshinae TaxID=93378 RepID=A0A376DBW7_9GAMM|nr:hypothetical protein [Edwardsiella hoshinae]QPR27643.1 hypothetical protein I6G97_14675 [Edwardsiella hoshinae]STC86580.1 Uncharacterised protein [Edwardsiella hoshinae]
MYLVGFLFYALIVFSYYFVDEIYEIINQSYLLAQALTIIMGAFYLYPLLIFIVICACSLKNEKAKKLIDSQTKLAASVSVSLGLIGTFQGLTAMVASIAKSMGGSSDMAEKMNAMLSAISSALSAMSYAFLTSILGVTISVLLLLSLNFWLFYFKDNATSKATKARNLTVTYDARIRTNFDLVDTQLTAFNDKLDRQLQLGEQTRQAHQEMLSALTHVAHSMDRLQQQLADAERLRQENVKELQDNVLRFKDKLRKMLEFITK